ncbi:PREDICTED: odorant receptor 4-like [Dinoponera quadriceps]|uniref:Odorant receptor n=1 Tax=Dinoponera quadriceps TaxID=609295 RepID=A0A6P3YB92_DINQU|nr:PREDICTED: odorant receptor 4-like [Dinoponera quadriceps]
MEDRKLMLKSIDNNSDHDYSLQLNRWYLKPIGAWPLTSASSTTEKVMLLIQVLVCWAIVCSIMIPCTLYVFFENVSIREKLSAIAPLLNRVMGSFNYLVLLQHSVNIRDCIEHMGADWEMMQKANDREVMMQHAKFGRFIAVICGVIMQGGTFLYGVAKAMKTVTIVIGNETVTMHPMTCPAYSKIIDTRYGPVNEIVLVVQILSTFVVSSATVGICSLAAVFATHASGQLNVLYMRLGELSENQKEDIHIAEQSMISIVEHHLRVLSFISRVENIMHKASLVELTGCTIILCLLGYYILLNWGTFDAAQIISYVIVYVSMAFNIFIFCYIGEILTEKCKHVGQMAYMTNWYKLNPKTARGLVLIIAQSSKVIKITAGKLLPLSIATFGDVLRTSIVYLNILRTMTM